VNGPAGEREIADADRLARDPLVSVVVLTYNHADYLAEALSSIAAQRCPFAFEIVVGEDCSTDATREIAFDFQRRFPDRIRVVVSDANVGTIANLRRVVARLRGRYVAFCEGDDYWHGEGRLAAQVALLEARPDATLVHTDWVRSRRGEHGWQVDWRRGMHYGMRPSLLAGPAFATFYSGRAFRTCTILHRREIVDGCFASPLCRDTYAFMDTILAAYALSRGPAAYLPGIGAVYRESPGSIMRSGRRARLRYLRSCLAFDTVARGYFAERGDYPDGYRWEQAFGLLVKALAIADLRTAALAFADLWRHYGIAAFVRCGWRAVTLRRRCDAWEAQRLALGDEAGDVAR
jgi:glycosyltransferase involved in cell wall biosynthesis